MLSQDKAGVRVTSGQTSTEQPGVEGAGKENAGVEPTSGRDPGPLPQRRGPASPEGGHCPASHVFRFSSRRVYCDCLLYVKNGGSSLSCISQDSGSKRPVSSPGVRLVILDPEPDAGMSRL